MSERDHEADQHSQVPTRDSQKKGDQCNYGEHQLRFEKQLVG